ncbi:LOC500845 [Phodopus roborovskii]|uniref:LOC500845 protein n=1 Tax=Phodopus roborovskii TaxID=109678 RepID=A0AAV0A7S5_PHORO|nr:LOC500845 [Phodopus roborovskii]
MDVSKLPVCLFYFLKACFILMTYPPEATGNPPCTDTREALFLGLFLLGQSLDDLLLLGLETSSWCFRALLVLDLQVQAVVHTAANLGFTVSPEKSTQDPHPSHPGQLLGHSHIGNTLPLPYAHMPALSHGLPDDQPIFGQLPDLLTGVGIGDFIGLIGVQPDLLFTTAEGGC